MTVWTDVSLCEVNAWLQGRGFCNAEKITPIEEGVEDSVYRLDLANGQIVCLRLFERTEPDGPVSIAQRLARCGLPTCPPIADSKGCVLSPLKKKPACLFPWVEGGWEASPNLSQIAAIGRFMGQMAKEGAHGCSDWHRPDPRGWEWFESTAARLYTVLEKDLRYFLQDEMEAHRQFWSGEGAHLPRGPVHADLFRNNVMFAPDGSLGAVIDWGFCASDKPFIYDLAIVANDWCLEEPAFGLDETKLKALMRAREEVCPLSPEEKVAWPMALRLAALRFYLSRLVDFHLPRDGAGKALDPEHFGRILRARKA